MKGKRGWKQRACLCLMVFLIGLPGLVGASSRDDIYREELDILYTMVQSGSSYILFGEERDDLLAVWEGVRDLSPEQGLEAVKYQLLDCNGDGKPELLMVRVPAFSSRETRTVVSPISPLKSPWAARVFNFCVASTALETISRRKMS